MEPGTKVRIAKGPLGIVAYLGATSFLDETAAAGETATVTGMVSGLDGWIYVRLDRDVDGEPAYVPVHPTHVEEV